MAGEDGTFCARDLLETFGQSLIVAVNSPRHISSLEPSPHTT